MLQLTKLYTACLGNTTWSLEDHFTPKLARIKKNTIKAAKMNYREQFIRRYLYNICMSNYHQNIESKALTFRKI